MKRTEDEIKLQKIIERYEDDKEVAKYAGMEMTLENYEFLVEQAKQAQELRKTISWGVSCSRCSNQLADEWEIVH